MAIATTLLYDKMEELRSASLTDSVWKNSAGSETLFVNGEQYIRAWQVGADIPRDVTVVVYTRNNAFTSRQAELVRATTLVSPAF